MSGSNLESFSSNTMIIHESNYVCSEYFSSWLFRVEILTHKVKIYTNNLKLLSFCPAHHLYVPCQFSCDIHAPVSMTVQKEFHCEHRNHFWYLHHVFAKLVILKVHVLGYSHPDFKLLTKLKVHNDRLVCLNSPGTIVPLGDILCLNGC